MILDAPLSSEMKQFIGDSLISAFIGYSDKSWNVRNSATMTFASIMLKVIDSDKNAGKIGSGSEVKVSYLYIVALITFMVY